MFDFPNVWHKELTTRDTPKAERAELGVGDIWTNAAMCLGCRDEIESWASHDFVTCSCGDLSVDSGSHDVRRAFSGIYEDRVQLYHDAEAEALKNETVVRLCEWLEGKIEGYKNLEVSSFLMGIRSSATFFSDDWGVEMLLGQRGVKYAELHDAIAMVERRRNERRLCDEKK